MIEHMQPQIKIKLDTKRVKQIQMARGCGTVGQNAGHSTRAVNTPGT